MLLSGNVGGSLLDSKTSRTKMVNFSVWVPNVAANHSEGGKWSMVGNVPP